MFLYNLVELTGSFKTIADKFTELTNGNRILQLLILGWCFPTFIQGACGFGVPVAVVTPLLIGLGFEPMLAVVTALMGHSWCVTFGSLGSSYSVLLQYTPEGAVDPGQLARWGALLIICGGLVVGLSILHNYRRYAPKDQNVFKEGLPAVFFLWAVMSVALFLTCLVSPYIGCFVAGAAGMIAGCLVLPKLPMYRSAQKSESKVSNKDFMISFSAYIILFCIVFAVYLIKPVKAALEISAFRFGFPFPENAIAFGYGNAAVKKYSALKIFTAPGTLIILSSILGALFYKSKNRLPEGTLKKAWTNTVEQSVGSTTTIVSMTMMAILMTEAGLTLYIAYGIASVAGAIYPIIAPFIGLLGGFVTSSGTSSNILFTSLQYNVANTLGISTCLILGAQTAGSSLSNSFSPGNAALGTGVSGQSGKEGEILKTTGVYNILQNTVVGLVAFLLIKLGFGL